MTTIEEVKVLEGYRITIPKRVRERLRIERGDKLRLDVEGARIILVSDKIPKNPTLKMLGIASGHDETIEEAVVEEVEEKLARDEVC